MSLNLGLLARLSYTGGCCEICFSHRVMTDLGGADGLLWSFCGAVPRIPRGKTKGSERVSTLALLHLHSPPHSKKLTAHVCPVN